jgi:nicotinamide-nucleotide amidase
MVDLEIISVGNELLIGKILNTNAHWLGKQATNIGANVKRITVVQDFVSEMASVICEALARKPEFIIITGGLGPTFDDKTLQGIAKALNRKLAVNQEAFEMVKEKCRQYSKAQNISMVEMTPRRVKMATLPEKTHPVFNPVGTAPGVRIDLNNTVLYSLPGVPSEMEAIFNQTIAPLLKKAVGDTVFCEKSMFVNQMAESNLAPLIDRVMCDNEGVYIKSHPMVIVDKPHIEAHLTIRAKKEEKPAEKIENALRQLVGLVNANRGEATV